MDAEKISVDGFNLNISDAKARNMISDKYDPDNGTYVVGDTCINDDILYICNTDIDTPEAFDSSKWDADTIGHYCSELKSNLTEFDVVTDATSVSGIVFRRTGKVVTVTVNMSITTNANNWKEFGTVPSGFRPSQTEYGTLIDKAIVVMSGNVNTYITRYVTIESTGKMSIYAPNAVTHNFAGTFEYIID